MIRQQGIRFLAILPLLSALSACGGGGDNNTGTGGGGGTGSTWQAGVFLPSTQFDGMCTNPRANTSDRTGTVIDQNNWLRSWTNETYLWYSEVTDRNPANYATADYFKILKTSATTPTGHDKDRFHFTYATDVWQALSQSGTEAGYGVEFDVLAPTPPRHIVVAFTEPGSVGDAQLDRGDEVLQVDGVDAVNGGTQANVDVLNAGLFPENTNETHSFMVRNTAGVTRTVSVTSTTVTHVPVPVVSTFSTGSGAVGYMLFNDHIGPAETPLIAGFNQLKNANVTDLILDLRYNGGGYLDMASEVAYMIANPTLTTGQTFERTVFNDKNPTRDPVTGETLAPTPFFSQSIGFPGGATANQPLPNLALNRVYILVGPGTCSASESIINSLRGANVQVYLIGSTTCGKPYGFYPTDNCGTTYFSIQFRGVNAANFGDYPDGFSPANQPTATSGVSVPGCSVADDYTHALGDVGEGRIAAALAFRASNNQTCPVASGFSDPRVSKASFATSDDYRLWVSKPAARSNRMMRDRSSL
jgi:carboxyl-terminal processing protease